MKELYINMTSGISGDMTLALLLSLGADKEKLSSILSSILSDFFYFSTIQKLKLVI